LNGILFAGISVRGGNSNTITQNNLINNLDGMSFVNTSYNLIVQNNVTSSPVWSPYTTGISFFGASNNTVYHNNFVNNIYQAQITNSVNIWDNGYSDGGNYWSDYQSKYPSATEIGNSGIWNALYVIDPNNTDRYPLVHQFDITAIAPIPTPTVPEFQLWAIPLLLIIMVVAGLLIYFKKHKNK
jgi:parallel beta-helix repeat protein